MCPKLSLHLRVLLHLPLKRWDYRHIQLTSSDGSTSDGPSLAPPPPLPSPPVTIMATKCYFLLSLPPSSSYPPTPL